MTTEVELKFLANRDISAELAEKLATYTLLARSDRQLANTYFDTPDRRLRAWQCGLRIRSQDGQQEQTIKCGGKAVAGLHQRPEYTTQLSGDWPQLADFPATIWPEGTDVWALQNELRPQFRTDFRRQAWQLLLKDGSEIELAFDLGVIAVADRQEPLCELELELLQGSPESLFILASDLLALGGLRLGSISKAQRGYRLAGLTPEPEVQRMSFAPVSAEQSVRDALFTVLNYGVGHWQYHEQLFMEQPSLAALSQLRNGIALLQQAQLLFGDELMTLAPRHWQEDLSWLERELAWLDEAHALERLTAERGHYFKTLKGHDELLRALQARQQALPSWTSLQELFSSTRYGRLILSLSQWLYAEQLKPERGQLTSEPLLSYAQAQLEQSWHELHDEEMVAPSLDYASYLALVGQLRRNLLAGVSFASLFNAQVQEGFRLPWLNILRHMEELELFEVLDSVSGSLSTKARLELGEWLTARLEPRLIELDQARQQALTMVPYWLPGAGVDAPV